VVGVPERSSLSPAMRARNANVRGGRGGRGRRGAGGGRGAWVARVAGAQWGAIGHLQLRDCGVGSSTVSRWVSEGRLHPRYPSVYAVGHSKLPVEGELTAALLAAGPGATLSHATAAWWWGLTQDEPRVIEISVPGRRRAPDGLRFYERRHLGTTHHRRLPITTVVQTLLDFAAGATTEQVRRALAEAEYHRLLDVARIPPEALGRGRPGSATLRAAIGRHQPQLARTRSELEKAFIALCESTKIPVPEFNTYFCGYLVDAIWHEQRVAVELDGHDGHHTPAQLERDHERDLVLRRNGFVVLRYTWWQLKRRRDIVAADLRSALAREASYQR